MKVGRPLVVALMVFGHPAFAQTKSEIAARMTPALRACEGAPENGGTLEQAICYIEEAARQEKTLNDTWKRVTTDLPAGQLKALRNNERLWIRERGEECRNEKSGYINSTAAYMYNICIAQEDARRTIWLEDRRHVRFAIPKHPGA